MSDQPQLCLKCQQPTDLGQFCHSCYREWKATLWRDVPSAQDEILELSKALNRIPDAERLRLATLLLRVMAGPFSDSLRIKLEAIVRGAEARSTATPARRGGNEGAE